MTPQEAAGYIRATFPIFRAHPEQWTKGQLIEILCSNPRFCVMGAARALRREKYRVIDLAKDKKIFANALGGVLCNYIIYANDDAENVEDMIDRVEKVLKEAGL